MKTSKRAAIILIPFALSVLYACANTTSVSKKHFMEFTGPPNCAECHSDDGWAAWNHKSPDFYARHKYFAATKGYACNSCHATSFCTDCHAGKEELKPGTKYPTSPERSMPHRGNYLSQHKIDGKINPTSCFRCHGRQNNEGCKRCHK